MKYNFKGNPTCFLTAFTSTPPSLAISTDATNNFFRLIVLAGSGLRILKEYSLRRKKIFS